MRKKDPDYVSGKGPPYIVSPWIVHPPMCVCAMCKRRRVTPEEWDRELVVRIQRASPHPNSRVLSAGYARTLKLEEEAHLIDAVRKAEQERQARANEVRFGTVCDAYRKHLQESGKRYDRARYPIANIEAFFGRGRQAESIDFGAYRELISEVSEMTAETKRHYASMLLAILNFAVAERIIKSHGLVGVRRPQVVKNDSPVIWSKQELAVLLGPAMDAYEKEQALWNASVGRTSGTGSLRQESYAPLRGLCYVAYFMLVRPNNNFVLEWSELSIDATADRGRYKLDQHKNVNKGIKAEGPLAEQLVPYLRAIRPTSRPAGLVHPNPSTGKAYVDIRKQWKRLVAIGSQLLGYELTGRKADFFTFRHTGASHLAEKTNNPILIVKMMGDVNIKTVMRHYFNLDYGFMEEMVAGWRLPEVEVAKDETPERLM